MSSSRSEDLIFPPVSEASEDGLLAVGGDLSFSMLYEAYTHGIFPWPQEGLPILWFAPEERGLLIFENFHVSRSFRKDLKKMKKKWRITWNQAFAQVIRSCSKVFRPTQQGTWILPDMIKAYTELHRLGFAQSIECWEGERLVGGLYGVFFNGVFSGESMFFIEDGASKFCLFHLVEHLKTRGFEWIDTQMVTPVLESFGGSYVKREVFMDFLEKSQKSDLSFF